MLIDRGSGPEYDYINRFVEGLRETDVDLP